MPFILLIEIWECAWGPMAIPHCKRRLLKQESRRGYDFESTFDKVCRAEFINFDRTGRRGGVAIPDALFGVTWACC